MRRELYDLANRFISFSIKHQSNVLLTEREIALISYRYVAGYTAVFLREQSSFKNIDSSVDFSDLREVATARWFSFLDKDGNLSSLASSIISNHNYKNPSESSTVFLDRFILDKDNNKKRNSLFFLLRKIRSMATASMSCILACFIVIINRANCVAVGRSITPEMIKKFLPGRLRGVNVYLSDTSDLRDIRNWKLRKTILEKFILEEKIQTDERNYFSYLAILVILLPDFLVENFRLYFFLSKPARFIPWKNKIILYRTIKKPISSFFILHAIRAKAHLVIIQHGGAFGENKDHPWCERELFCSDTFVSWGWGLDISKEFGHEPNVLSLPSLRLQKFKEEFSRKSAGQIMRESDFKKASKVLVVFTGRNREKITSGFLNNDIYNDFWKKTLQQENSLERLTVSVRSPKKGNDYAASFMSLLSSSFSIVTEHDKAILPISTALAESDLIIIEGIFSTTFLECVAVNCPVIVIDPILERLTSATDGCRRVIDKLISVGVICTDTSSFAHSCKNALTDVNEWWMETNRQEAVNDYKKLFALVTNDAALDWKLGLESILELHN